MDQMPHNGLLWEKVAEMNLSERDLIDSFDSEADFVNYMARSPKIAWESVKGDKMAKLKAKAESATDDDDPVKGDKPKAKTKEPAKAKTMADIEKRLSALEADEGAD
jgi:hypothetical protein